MGSLGSVEQKYVLVQMKTYHGQPAESLGTQGKLHNLSCTTVRMYLMPLNCMLKNGKSGTFCVMYVLAENK